MMRFGRGRNLFGPGFWKRWPGGRPYGGRYERGGRGGGNPYPFCRRLPWLHRGWWAWAGGYAWPGVMIPEDQRGLLRQQELTLRAGLEELSKRISELEHVPDRSGRIPEEPGITGGGVK
jgi:hypothetical protein